MLGEDEKLHRRDVDIICAGINHQTWYIQVQWRGMDMIPMMLDLFEAHPQYRETEKVRIDMIRRFGYYTTESNGHVSEYVPWYRKRPEEINDWIDLSSWINGETGGYLRVCTEGRNWFETDFPNWLKQDPPVIAADKRSEEHGSYIIEALETGRIYRGHFNLPNENQITNLPNGCIIEIPVMSTRMGSTCLWSVICRWLAPLPVPPAYVCRRWPWKRPSMAMSPCSSKPCFMTR
ncbi:MAG: hypothetical protein R2867_08405 [Caldilineaceae bacterium]